MLEKEDVIEEESNRGIMRNSESELVEDAGRRKVELEQGIKRAAETGTDQPEATRIKIQALEEDELHEDEWMRNELDYDTNTREALDPNLVKKGKDEEMMRFKEMGVYRYVIREEAHEDPNGVIIDVRWVIVNKGTREEPQCTLPTCRS